ncbi:MAG: 2-oxoacid:acceptor oxidoreductase family protein [Candidatus Izemoplasmatales bacterium]|nr:2-oxoacid:acceptor oxidoreductase family protein [Candidatus Izemoplasmatales bacterium]MDD3864704.1 2-oxoacid:acceptor oxidoreductase family protein [Candidatus Izemoplasmatales bacterium]
MCKAINIRVAGFGGQGVMMTGQLMAYCATYENMFSLWVPSYGPETRGGTANCSVIVSTKTIASPVFMNADVLIAFNLPSLTKYMNMVVDTGVILYNSSMIKDPVIKQGIKAFGIPVNDIAIGLGTIQVSNMVMLGAYMEFSGLFSDQTVEKVLEKFLGEKKAHLLGINKQAIQAGREAMIAVKE